MKAERTLLISDLHLEEARPDITGALLGFLRTEASAADALYILGDFFNLWIGDDGGGELADTVGAALAALAARGTRVHLMHGNRDFLIGEDFCARCQAVLLPDSCLLETGGRRYLLMHGDTLCTRDTDYQRFRAMVRDRAWQADFLGRPLAERQAYAAQVRNTAKTMASNKAEDIMDVSQDAVEQVLREHDNPVLVHGHTHRPATHDFRLGDQAARRIVLGDWDRRGWYLELGAAGERLVDFPLSASAG